MADEEVIFGEKYVTIRQRYQSKPVIAGLVYVERTPQGGVSYALLDRLVHDSNVTSEIAEFAVSGCVVTEMRRKKENR